jgi:pimeloyl-ACP methyl ester carboxylesterase
MGKTVHKLLQSLSIQQYFLVGHSMGGYVSLGMTEKFAGEMKGLILLHSHPFADNEEKKQTRLKEAMLVKEGKKNLLIQTFLPKLYSSGFTDEETLAFSKKMATGTTDEGMIACLQAMSQRQDRSEWLKNPPIPVLWFYGKNDQLFNCEFAEKLDVSSNVTKVLLNNSGHLSMYEETEKVVNQMDAFLLNNK